MAANDLEHWRNAARWWFQNECGDIVPDDPDGMDDEDLAWLATTKLRALKKFVTLRISSVRTP